MSEVVLKPSLFLFSVAVIIFIMGIKNLVNLWISVAGRRKMLGQKFYTITMKSVVKLVRERLIKFLPSLLFAVLYWLTLAYCIQN